MNYIQCPSGRKIYGNKILLKFGLDWINLFGLILILIIGIMMFKEIF